MKRYKSNLLLDHVLGHRTKLDILRVLYRNNSGISGREVGRCAYLSYQTAFMILTDFIRRGILKRNRKGNAYQYFLNEGHWFINEFLIPAFKKESAEAKSNR